MATDRDEIKRQTDECLYEKSKLDSIESDFTQRYNKKMNDIEAQFKKIFDALIKRQNDAKQWREQEYTEGITHINRHKAVLEKRLNELQHNPNDETLCRVPELKDIYLAPFKLVSLQIQNVTNIIFQLCATYQQNVNNRTVISFKMNENPQNTAMNIRTRITPQDKRKFLKRTVTERHKLDLNQSAFGKGKNLGNIERRKPKTYGTTPTQSNGTKALQYNTAAPEEKQNAIRGFDIGNNAKYDNAQEMAKHTNALPDNFWDEPHGSDDSDESHAARQQLIARRWKTERSNINKESHRNVNNIQQRAATQRARHVYNNDTSSDEDTIDSRDGFAKYVPPKHKVPMKQKPVRTVMNYKRNNTRWIVQERGLQHKYDTLWFQVPKMRNGKANSSQMKQHLDSSGLSKNVLKQIWKLSDLDKDGKMGNEEFVLCMFLIDQVREGRKLPHVLPPNYIPPSFRGQDLIKTPPRRPISQPSTVIFGGYRNIMQPQLTTPERLSLTPSKSSPVHAPRTSPKYNKTLPHSHSQQPPSYRQAMYRKERRRKCTEEQDPVSFQ